LITGFEEEEEEENAAEKLEIWTVSPFSQERGHIYIIVNRQMLY